MDRLTPRLTFANVISVIALFVALGGTGLAASQLGKDSVGSKQLKKNAVTGAKVKNQSLTGKDIKLSKLGTVPSATHANSADSIPAAEPAHVIGAPGEPGFQSGDTNAESGVPGFAFTPVSFYKDHEGIVHLEGRVAIGGEGAIFTLPPGYRPAQNALVPAPFGFIAGSGVNANVGGTVSEGNVWTSANPGEFVLLSGITFRAES
jgi:hypothetical protein